MQLATLKDTPVPDPVTDFMEGPEDLRLRTKLRPDERLNVASGSDHPGRRFQCSTNLSGRGIGARSCHQKQNPRRVPRRARLTEGLLPFTSEPTPSHRL